MSILGARSKLFGSENRTAVLLAVRLLQQTWPSELAKVLSLRLFTVQQILSSFEDEGIVATRTMGRTRVVTLNPRYYAAKELDALTWKLAIQNVELQQALAQVRRRPRATGKPGLEE